MMRALIILLFVGSGLAACSSRELDPVPLEEARAVAAKFDNLRLGMSPEKVRSTLGLDTVAKRMVRYEGAVPYKDMSVPPHLSICIMRDGYAFLLTYAESATNGLALMEYQWQSWRDWPKGVTNLNQSLASLKDSNEGVKPLKLNGFKVEVKRGGIVDMFAVLYVETSRFEEVANRQAEIKDCIKDLLTGLKVDLTATGLTDIQLDIRNTLNSRFGGHPVRYVSLGWDHK